MGCVPSKTETEQPTLAQPQPAAAPPTVEVETRQPSGKLEPKEVAEVAPVSAPDPAEATEPVVCPAPEEDPSPAPSHDHSTAPNEDLSIRTQEEEQAVRTQSMQSMVTSIDSPSDATLTRLQTLRETHNAHASQSFDDSRLRAFVSSAFSEDDDDHSVTRSIYLNSKEQADSPMSQGSHSNANASNHSIVAPIAEAPASPLSPSGAQRKPPSPAAGVDRKRVGPVINPGKRLIMRKPLVSEQRGELDDFSMDGDQQTVVTAQQQQQLQPTPALASPISLPVSPNLRTVTLPTQKPLLHSKSANMALDTSSAPASKRGFLRTSESRSPNSKSYHVLDAGTLYQIDGVSKVQSKTYGMDNKTINLRNSSLDVRDHVIDIVIDEGVPNSPGRRVVSFEVRNEEERKKWVDALQEHIQYSGMVGTAE